MPNSRPTTILCMASYEKGQEFIRECKQQGCRVLLVTVEKLRDVDWGRENIDELYYMPDLLDRVAVANGISYLARTESIDRIVALDEFDLEMAAFLREHLRIAGLGETATRVFRDKLAMREAARAGGVLVPDFVGAINHDRLREFVERVPAPWVLKPRLQASAVGIRKLHDADSLWQVLEQLGDEQSAHLLERYLPGDVYHVDGIVYDDELRFAEVNRYSAPPFDVMHGGGLFCTRTVERGSEQDQALRLAVADVIDALDLARGVLHCEFIRRRDDGKFYFLEAAARVGGANIADMVEAATGINLWREWARTEVAAARGEPYELPPTKQEYAGVLITLARQEWPDTSAYADPEVVWRMQKKHHAGLIVASPDSDRVQNLLDGYMRRFRDDFFASLPAPDKPTS